MSFEKNWPRIELKQAEARVDKLYKNYRIMRRQEDKGINEELKSNRRDGTDGFNDLGLCSRPPRRRKKT